MEPISASGRVLDEFRYCFSMAIHNRLQRAGGWLIVSDAGLLRLRIRRRCANGSVVELVVGNTESESTRSGNDATTALIERLRRKDQNAGAELNRLYREALMRFCWGYLGRIEEAEDAVQDVTCKVLSASDVPDDFRPWLYKITRNHCLNLLRQRAYRKDAQNLPGVSQVYEALTGQLTRMVKDEARSRLTEMVQALDESQREVLRLRYVEDLSRTEIAAVLDIPESVVKSRIFEGLKKLREHAARLAENES